MKILVTGGCGFIGSNFIEFLLTHTDYHIINVDSLTYAGVSYHPTSERYTFLHMSIGDSRISDLLKEKQPDLIVNFAAETHVDRSITDPDVFVKTNLIDTYNFLCNLRRYNETGAQFRFVHISTDEVYGHLSTDDPPFTETTPYAPNSPYSATKAGGDHLVRAFNQTFNLPAIITHCTNNYGPRQYPEKLIPTVIRKAMKNERIPVYGTGMNIRDWLHVDDHCRALYRVLLDGKIGSVYNIGGNSERTNIDVVKLILHIMNRDESLIEYVEDRKGHDFRYAMSTYKIEKELGWKPSVTFEEGLYKTVEWYLSNVTWMEQCEHSV